MKKEPGPKSGEAQHIKKKGLVSKEGKSPVHKEKRIKC